MDMYRCYGTVKYQILNPSFDFTDKNTIKNI